MNFIISQILSLISGAFLIIGIRTQKKIKFLCFNSISNLLGFLSMIILKTYAASVGPVVLTIQGIVTYVYAKNKKKQPKLILFMYLFLNVVGGIITVNSFLGFVSIVASCLASIMLMCKNMKTARKINLLSSLLTVPYLIYNRAYVNSLIFIGSFINTLDAIYKIDYKKKNEIFKLLFHLFYIV